MENKYKAGEIVFERIFPVKKLIVSRYANKGISKNPSFHDLNPSPFSGREVYKEFLEMPISYITV